MPTLSAVWRRLFDIGFGLAAVTLIAWSLFLRTAEITHVPGINGDEAYTATKALLWLRGDAISLRTGSGLVADPLSFAQLVGLHLLFPPSPWLIRAPAVLNGVASVAIAFYLGWRLWGARTAVALAVLFACLPAHLAYARFGWEPAGTPLAAVLVLASAFLWPWGVTLSLFVLALLVHPTNVFLAPIALAVQGIRGSRFDGRQFLTPVALAVSAAGIGLAALLASRVPALADRAVAGFAGMTERLTIGEPLQLFATRYLDLLSGVAVYRYLVDPADPPTGWLHRSIASAALLAILLLVYGGRPAAGSPDTRRGRQAARRLMTGVLASLGLFYLAAGPEALRPNVERYGLWMIAPHCLLLVSVLDACIHERVRGFVVQAACIALAGLALLSFQAHYWRALHERNSRTERTFQSGPVEPKSAAFDEIDAARRGAAAVIYADSWWTYWPLKYRSLGVDNVAVTIEGMGWDSRFPPDFAAAPPPDARRFHVRFHGDDPAMPSVASHTLTLRRQISGFGNLPVIDVFQEVAP